MSAHRYLPLGAALIALGCTGQIGEPSGGPTDDPSQPPGSSSSSSSFKCDPAKQPETTKLRRLTVTQYRNTVRDLARWALGSSDGEAVVARMPLAELPEDRREPVPQDIHGSYRRLDQSLQQTHLDGFYQVGTDFGAALTEPARLGKVVGACATDADAKNDAQCLTDFIRRFGEKTLRRPLGADDVTFFQSVYGASPNALPAAYADVIAVMLNTPEFLYFVEHGDKPVAGKTGVYALSAHELASRLSYHFLETMPDAELWAAAQDGSLLEPDVYERQVSRLADDPRAQQTLREFFADWLKTQELSELDKNVKDPLFAAFAGADLPGSALRQHVIDEALDMVAYHVWKAPAGIAELFQSELSFAKTADLAKIYGTSPWDGVSTPPSLPSGQRPGLLTRALFLATGSANTRPIMKGVFIRRHVLCDEIGPPPPGANAKEPELRPDMTTRQVVEELTQAPGSVCAGCHGVSINPLGFATEGFDALGRFRTEQRLFDGQGKLTGKLPVDTRSVPLVTPGDQSVSQGPADLARLLVQSGKLEACLSRNYFRFTYARWEDPSRDGCALESYRKRLVSNGRIRDMLKEAALTQEFRQKSFD